MPGCYKVGISWFQTAWQNSCAQLRKCAAGDIVPSLTRLKMLGTELTFFVSIFRKYNQINIKNRGKWQPSKIMIFFLTYISPTHETIKPPSRAAIKKWLNTQIHKFWGIIIFSDDSLQMIALFMNFVFINYLDSQDQLWVTDKEVATLIWCSSLRFILYIE